MRIALLSLVVTSFALAGCGGISYKPVSETDFNHLVTEGCSAKDVRLNVTALISAAYMETLVLADPSDTTRTVAVLMPKEGLWSKTRGVIGKSRYEVGLETLRRLKDSGSPVEVSLRCTAKDRAAIALRVRYVEDGAEREIEFDK